MNIREIVKQSLVNIRGNYPFRCATLAEYIDASTSEDTPYIQLEQIKRALRDIPYVRKLADGRYVVKGRRVPPKVDITKR